MATQNCINITLPLTIAGGGTNATSMATTNGVVYYDGTRLVTSGAGTSTQTLKSNGAGNAPTYGAVTDIKAYNFHTGSGDANVTSTGQITIAGGTNQITTTGASATVTVALPTSFTSPGAITAGTTMTATTVGLTVTSGNILLPTTSSTVGIIKQTNPLICTYGTRNMFCGYKAGNFTLTGTDNCILGTLQTNGIGYVLTTGSRNSLFCSYVGAQFITTGSDNTAAGIAPADLTTGSYNTGFGQQCLRHVIGGDYNISISYGAYNITATSSNIGILHNMTVGNANRIYIGVTGSSGGQQNTFFLAGVSGVTVSNNAAVLINTSTYQLGTVASSEKYKTDIADMSLGSEFILKLRPVCFTYKKDTHKQYGLIAEEVLEVAPNLVSYIGQDEPVAPPGLRDDNYVAPPRGPDLIGSVMYHDLPVLILNEIKKQQERIADLITRIALYKRINHGNN